MRLYWPSGMKGKNPFEPWLFRPGVLPLQKNRLKTQGFPLPVQQGGKSFFPVFRNGFQRGPGNQEGAFHAQLFSFFIPEFAQAGQIVFKLVGMLSALDAGPAWVVFFIQQVNFWSAFMNRLRLWA